MMDIECVNQLSSDDFIQTFGNVVECSPYCAAAVVEKRPFVSFEDLYRHFCDYVDNLNTEGRSAVLRSHPELAGRLAQCNSLTEESTIEQRAAGLNNLSKDEMQLIEDYNYKYQEKFRFPFVICARLNNKDTIINGLQTRLENNLDKELDIGIGEVKKIMLLRLKDLVNTCLKA